MITSTLTEPALNDFSLPAPKTNTDNKLGQGEFLTLMITQLQNQDPLSPMDNGEFIAQMAQFSAVEGISQMSQSLASLTESMNASQVLQASTMIGRNVLVEGDTTELGADQPLQGAVELPFATSSASVTIFDLAGQPVRTIDLGPRTAGTATFVWDGLLDNGQTAPADSYRITGRLGTGTDQTALTTYISARVQSVSMTGDGRGAQITTEDGLEVSLSQVKAIM